MSNLDAVRNTSSRVLSLRMHSKKELYDKLKSKGYDIDDINVVIGELLEDGYLDDYAYAYRLIERSYEKHRGRRRILMDLDKAGIDSKTADFAFEDFLYENEIDEMEIALDIARKEIELGGEINQRLLDKIARKLDRQGFDNIYSIINKIKEWKDIEEP